MQGTGAIVPAVTLVALRITGVPLRDQRIVISAPVRRRSDDSLLRAAEAVAGLVDATAPGASLLPRVDDLWGIAAAAAWRAAVEDLARVTVSDPARQVRDAMWPLEYRPIRAG